jgi:hypothetical protein
MSALSPGAMPSLDSETPTDDRPLGSTVPRLFTPPLVDLTPDTSYGFAVIEFARDVLFQPLDPWQEWLVIHAGELLADGRPRFRQVLVLVARQNGKTHVAQVLTLFWLFVECWSLVLGTSTNLDYAREAWEATVLVAETTPALSVLTPRHGIRRTNGQEQFTTSDRARYKIAASNRKGGRSLSVDRLVLDELREHRSWSAWNAAVPAMNARPAAQLIAITNQGDDDSLVLNSLRAAALNGTDPRLGLFEWSAPDGCALTEVAGHAAANPNLNRRLDHDSVMSAARRAELAGGEEETGFRTEMLCQRVRVLDAAVDPMAWSAGNSPGTLPTQPKQVVLCVDISPDQLHATLLAAALVGDQVRIEPIRAWSGADATAQLRADLPGIVKAVRPLVLGWLPTGPAASLAVWLRTRLAKVCKVEEIKADAPAVCMGFAEQVRSGSVLHSGDPLLDAQVLGAARRWTADRWVFGRAAGHCDAVYAAAGAVHLARAHPPLTHRGVITVPRP